MSQSHQCFVSLTIIRVAGLFLFCSLKPVTTHLGQKIACNISAIFVSRSHNRDCEEKPRLFRERDSRKWILGEWRLQQSRLSDDSWDDVITDWTMNYIVSSGSAACRRRGKLMEFFLSSTFALRCITAAHLRLVSITRRNTRLAATAAAATAAANRRI